MIRMSRAGAAALALAMLVAAPARADVKTQEKSLVKFGGMLGRMVGMFGGKAAREGVVTTVVVSGDRKLTVTGDTGELVDLAEEKIYSLDMDDKTYTVTTFDELRRRLEEARQKAEEQAAEQQGAQPSGDQQAPEYEVDFDVKESGQQRTINGFDAREVIMTITVRQKGQTLEEAGGMVLTTNTWLAPSVPGGDEIAAFDRRYAEKLASAFMGSGSAEQMAAALAMYPGLQEALKKLEAENVNLEGTAVLTDMKVEAVAGAAQQAAQAEREEERPRGLGGMLGGLSKRIGQRVAGGDQAAQGPIMTMQHELLSATTDVTAAEAAIPEGFREK